MPASIVVSSGSDRIVHVYPDRERTSSGGSARSPTSSGGSRSLSSEESWSEVEYEDDIDPSDSASRSRQPASRRHTVEARPAPARRQSSRRVIEPEEPPPRRHSARRHTTTRDSSHSHSRHGRSSSRRVPSDESSSTVASADDYPYSHHGPPRGYHAPMPPSYGRAPPSHGGYPPSMTSAGGGGYPDPYGAPHQALVHMQRPADPFGYPQPNPFAPQSHQQSNPFSPISSQESSNYFATDPMSPPEPPHQRQGRPHGPPRPQSFAAPSQHYGSELMAPYHQPMPPYGGYMPGPPGPYAGYPPMHGGWPMPTSNTSSPPPPKPDEETMKRFEALQTLVKDEKKELHALLEKKGAEEGKQKDERTKEIESLKELIKKQEAEAKAQAAAWKAEREAEIARQAAEKAKAEEEKRRKQELEDARKKAKEDAEKKAEEAAKKAEEEHKKKLEEAEKVKEEADKKAAEAAKAAEEEHQKKLAEAEKAKEEVDKAKKALEDEIAKNKPTPDSLKPPIKFKDAVGRKFSFPWALCKSWKGMEGLIKQAFLHVDVIGDHVHQGHYDLTGPDGEIILPQVWDTMVQPDWEITMHLWPMEEEKKKEKEPHPADLIDPFANMGMGSLPGLGDFGMLPGDMGVKKSSKSGKKGDAGKKAKKGGSPETVMVHPMMPPPPPAGSFGDPFAGMGMGPGGIIDVPSKPAKTKARSQSKSKNISPLAAWFAGGSLNAKAPRKK